jgi:hypothetical protein
MRRGVRKACHKAIPCILSLITVLNYHGTTVRVNITCAALQKCFMYLVHLVAVHYVLLVYLGEAQSSQLTFLNIFQTSSPTATRLPEAQHVHKLSGYGQLTAGLYLPWSFFYIYR